jgi:hypothetical protein
MGVLYVGGTTLKIEGADEEIKVVADVLAKHISEAGNRRTAQITVPNKYIAKE